MFNLKDLTIKSYMAKITSNRWKLRLNLCLAKKNKDTTFDAIPMLDRASKKYG